jgi:hypothetical protein
MKNDKKVQKSITVIFAAIIVLSLFGAITPIASAACNDGSVNVAFVPHPNAPGGGTLATTNSAFSAYNFTDMPYASVNAATLANYDTVVLITCNPINDLTASQRTDIVNWVSNGGKLILYDSECVEQTGVNTVDYSWLPCSAMSYGPGGLGASKSSYPWVDLWIVEDNTLSSSDSTSPYFINATMIAYSTDGAGDQNVFIAEDPCWCGDMIGTNAIDDTGAVASPGTTGYSHAYLHYGTGLIIYNGLDVDYMGSGSDPTVNTGGGYIAKIWLLELNQTWDNTSGIDICGLPCTNIIPTPAPEAAPALTPVGLLALVGLLSAVAAITLRKKR